MIIRWDHLRAYMIDLLNLFLQVFSAVKAPQNVQGQIQMSSEAGPELVQLSTAGFLCLAAGSLYGWSGLSSALSNEYGVGATEVGTVFSVAILAFTGALLIAARLPDRLRGLPAATFAGAFGTAATILAAAAHSYPLFLAAFGLGFGSASGMIYASALDIAAAARKPSVAAPTMVALFGLGGAIFGGLMRYLVGQGEGLWSIWPVTCAIGAATLVGLVVLSRGPLRQQNNPALTAREVVALPTRKVATLWVLFAFAAMPGLMCLGLSVQILSDRAASPDLSSLAVFLIACGNTGGRLVVAFLQRLLGPAAIVMLGTLLCDVSLAGLLASHTSGAAVVLLVVLATGYGVIASGMPVLTRSFTEPWQFGRVFPLILTGWGAAGLLAPRISGQIRDATGQFNLAFWLCLAASLLAAVVCGLLMRMISGSRPSMS